MSAFKLIIDHVYGTVSEEEILAQGDNAVAANKALHNGTRPGNDFLGWVNLPSSIDESYLKEIEDSAAILRKECEAVVVVGIGGSYLGTKAVVDALSSSFDWLQTKRENPVLLYAGKTLVKTIFMNLQNIYLIRSLV